MARVQVSDSQFETLLSGQTMTGVWGDGYATVEVGQTLEVAKSRFDPKRFDMVVDPHTVVARVIRKETDPRGVVLSLTKI